MTERHRVGPGECIVSIATERGFFPDTVWDHPENAELKALRRDPNVLLPGDMVFIPDLRPREESIATGQRHVFRRRGVPVKLRMRLRRDDKPRVGVRYVLTVAGTRHEGVTGPNGEIEHWIPPAAKEGLLVINRRETHKLRLGMLDPVTEESGVRARLLNLRYLRSASAPAARLERALRSFQRDNGLSPTGTVDDATRDALVADHGS